MSREPYEKPKVESIDLGNLVQETRSGLEAAAARLDHVKGRLEVMSIELGEAEADFALALAEFEESKKKLLKLQAVEQLQEGLMEEIERLKAELGEAGSPPPGGSLRQRLERAEARIEELEAENERLKGDLEREASIAVEVTDLEARIEAALARAACREDDEHDGVTLAAVVKALR